MSQVGVRQVAGLIVVPLLAVLIVMGVGAAKTHSLGGRPAVVAMVVAGAISSFATLCGSIPVAWVARRTPTKVPLMALGAMLIRMVVLAALVVPVSAMSHLPLRALLLWAAITYVVALFAETLVLTSVIRRMGTSG